jgi:hypothetical protein
MRRGIFQEGVGFAATGPAQLDPDEDGRRTHVVDLWANSSLQMQRICQGNGIAYLHFLQPNQYLPGSKPMTEPERQKFVSETQEYGKAIKAIYPLLINRSPILQQKGVDFHDLTMLFSEVHEPIYADPFCHFNQLGNHMLAKSIADAIRVALE